MLLLTYVDGHVTEATPHDQGQSSSSSSSSSTVMIGIIAGAAVAAIIIISLLIILIVRVLMYHRCKSTYRYCNNIQ